MQKTITTDLDQKKLVDQLNEEAWNIRRKDLKAAYEKSVAAEEEARLLKYPRGIADGLKTQGYCLWRFSDYSSSMKKSKEALIIAEELGDLKSKADILNNIGAVYMFLNEHEKRLKCNLECYKIRKQIGDKEGVAGSLNNIGETYMQMKKFDKAIECFMECLNSPDCSYQIAGWNYHNLGLIELEQGNLSSAKEYFKKSIEATKKVAYKVLECDSHFQLGKTYEEEENFTKAIENLKSALSIAEAINAKEELTNIYFELSRISEIQGELEAAFQYFKLYNKYHNLVYNEENDRIISNLKHQYEIDALQKETEIQKLKNIELKNAYDEIETQKDIILKHNISIRDSIEYARHIQKAILRADDHWSRTGSEHFIFFKPKDVVSGDFYWSYAPEDSEWAVWTAADCTGHGVPGAFMSMLGVGFLNDIVIEGGIIKPNEILDMLRNKISTALQEKQTIKQRQDGMDMALCALNSKNNTLAFSGAYNSAIIITQNKELLKEINDPYCLNQNGYYLFSLPADKQPVGISSIKKQPFKYHEIELSKGDLVYTFSDGYHDQFGGKTGKKFMSGRFRELLLSICTLPLSQQKEKLKITLTNWMQESNQEQIDDICVIGVKI